MKRTAINLILVLFAATTVAIAGRQRVSVKVLSSNSQTSESVTPGHVYTACYWGNNSLICNEYTYPPGTQYRIDVVNHVEFNGMVYTIGCSAQWIWNRCEVE